MSSYKYLIIGGGMTGHAAALGIRDHDTTAPIGMLSAEPHRPYKRPPLSKALWKGEPRDSIWLPPIPGLELLVGCVAEAVDREKKEVLDDQGNTHTYGALLLATGGKPKRLGFGGDRVIYFRSLDDFDRLRALPPGSRVAVIGGGFIGTELAAGLAMNDHHVTLFLPEATLGARHYPPALCEFLTGTYRAQGVDVRPGTKVTSITADGKAARVRFPGGDVSVDVVVAGLGIAPNVSLALGAGLAVDDGIIVDRSLRTSDNDIFAAGDVARFGSDLLGRHRRVEHEDNAVTMGRAAGAAMTGAPVDYHHEPFFYSDLFDVGFEAIGEIDARLEMVADWKSENREGVIYYLKNGRARGVVTWGIFGQMDQARALMAEPGPHEARALLGRLPRGPTAPPPTSP